jgi:hypothetical protein
MTRFTKPTYAELQYRHRFHFVPVLNTATKATKIIIFPLLNYTSCHEDVRGSGDTAPRFFLSVISVPGEVD